jgi:hypothetical protein
MTEATEVKVARIEEKVDTVIRMQRSNEQDIRANETALRAEVKELRIEIAEMKQSLSKIYGGVTVIAAIISALTWLADRIIQGGK